MEASAMEASALQAKEHGVDASIRVVVNGEPVVLDVDPTVADLVAARALAGKRIAIERNGEIVPRSRHATTVLVAGDRVEIVVAVGGG
jgi:sulfur carrier protein